MDSGETIAANRKEKKDKERRSYIWEVRRKSSLEFSRSIVI
jgi:hypothetical protein